MYYLSKYNHITKTENTFLVFNTFTQALADLDESTYNDLIQMNVDSKDKDHFLELGFWVTYNELEKIKAANEQATLNESTLFVVLKMTDACNFRCPYCYQDHIAQFLDERKLQIIKKFISQKIDSTTESLSIHYFGGEPLLNLSAVLEIDSYLQGLTDKYSGFMTTNGFLLNLDCIQKLKQTKIERYQITIDGPEHIHNQTRVVQDGSGSFQTLIANIKNLLSETEAKVTIRNNLSKANMNYAAELMEYLHTEGILDSDRVHVLFQELHNYSDSADYSVFFKDNEYFPAMLKLKRLLMQYGKPVHAYGPLKNSCRIYQNNTFVIGSNLDLECCTTDDKAIGHINEDGVPIWNTNLEEKKRFYAPDTSCDSCILLPMCMGGCPYKRSKEQCSCIMDPEDLLEYIILLRDSTIKFNAK